MCTELNLDNVNAYARYELLPAKCYLTRCLLVPSASVSMVSEYSFVSSKSHILGLLDHQSFLPMVVSIWGHRSSLDDYSKFDIWTLCMCDMSAHVGAGLPSAGVCTHVLLKCHNSFSLGVANIN